MNLRVDVVNHFLNRILFLSCFLAFSTLWAASARDVYGVSGKSRVFGAVDSKVEFSGDRLFAVLDSVGGTGTWMEWDVNGIRDPSVMLFLKPMLESKNKPKMIWVLSERSKPLLAVLLPKGEGELLMFYELSKLDAKPESLRINSVLTPDVVFRDYRQISEKEFVHYDRPNLKVLVSDKRILFTYRKPDSTPLRFDSDFKTKNLIEKKNEVRDYMGFLQYEYSLMLRAFVQSVRGVFNWQPWHWYMQSWNSKYMISEEEVEAILSRGLAPDYFTVFKAKTSGGEWVELRTTGNGVSEMVITMP